MTENVVQKDKARPEKNEVNTVPQPEVGKILPHAAASRGAFLRKVVEKGVPYKEINSPYAINAVLTARVSLLARVWF